MIVTAVLTKKASAYRAIVLPSCSVLFNRLLGGSVLHVDLLLVISLFLLCLFSFAIILGLHVLFLCGLFDFLLDFFGFDLRLCFAVVGDFHLFCLLDLVFGFSFDFFDFLRSIFDSIRFFNRLHVLFLRGSSAIFLDR